jgi:SAM-dependent methyltransferase
LISTIHLDLGCGETPKNPYKQDRLCAIDLVRCNFDCEIPSHFEHKVANLFVDNIPYPDSYFDSVSAFDFLEHVPRHLILPDGSSRLPFVELMNEIYRVLKPGGVFLASTPAYPNPKAFQDPTHLNIITERTHEYFVGDKPYGRRYGFIGVFKLREAAWDAEKNAWNRDQSMLNKFRRNMEHRLFKGGLSHLTWEFVAQKVVG